jgi:flagellar basal-body rod protein FlgF
VQDFGLVRDLSEGPMTATGNNLDFAIHGSGYFAVDTPQGERYTRVGRFQLDAQDQLVTSQGHAVLDTGGAPIFAPAEDGEIVVARDGTISVNGEPLGRIAVVQFEDEQAMRKLAGGLYTGDDPQPALDAEIVQGMVEDSNVEPVLELTRMITVLRSYQSAQRMMETEHERQRRAISTLVSSNS